MFVKCVFCMTDTLFAWAVLLIQCLFDSRSAPLSKFILTPVVAACSENFPVFYHSRSFILSSFILSTCGCCMRKGSYRNTKHKYFLDLGQMFDSLCDFWVFVLFFTAHWVKMTMLCPLVGRTKLSHRIRYFFIWGFVAAHVTCSNSEWGYRAFL